MVAGPAESGNCHASIGVQTRHGAVSTFATPSGRARIQSNPPLRIGRTAEVYLGRVGALQGLQFQRSSSRPLDCLNTMSEPSQRTLASAATLILGDLGLQCRHDDSGRLVIARGDDSIKVFVEPDDQSITISGPWGHKQSLASILPAFYIRNGNVMIDIRQIGGTREINQAFEAIFNRSGDRRGMALNKACSCILFGLAGTLLFGVAVTGGFVGLDRAFARSQVRAVIKQQISTFIMAAFTAIAHEFVFKLESVLRKIFLDDARVIPMDRATNVERAITDLVANELGAIFIVGGTLAGLAALPATRSSGRSFLRENGQFFAGFAAWDVLKTLIAQMVGGAERVIDVNSRSINAGKLAELRNELSRIWNREIRSRATRVALLRIFAKFTASMTIFNLFTAVTPALIGQGQLSGASGGVRAADIFIKNGIFAFVMLTTIRLISLAILDDPRH
jgi:hypothetical protein